MGEVREDLEKRLRTPLNTDHRCSCGDGDGYDRCLYCEALMRNERERTEAADELTRLRAEVAQLREERDRYRAALEEIVDPIGAMQRWADAEGYRLDGAMAVSLAKDSGHLQNIARRALTPTGADHDKEVTHGDC